MLLFFSLGLVVFGLVALSAAGLLDVAGLLVDAGDFAVVAAVAEGIGLVLALADGVMVAATDAVAAGVMVAPALAAGVALALVDAGLFVVVVAPVVVVPVVPVVEVTPTLKLGVTP